MVNFYVYGQTIFLGEVCYSAQCHTVEDVHRGELSYLAHLGSENISAPYFKQCFFRGRGDISPQTESNTTPPSPKTEITNILFYILNFASIIKFILTFLEHFTTTRNKNNILTDINNILTDYYNFSKAQMASSLTMVV